MPFFLYGFILFIVIAWALQAWDVYQIKLINPLGNFFANRGQLIWIAFSFWLLLFLFLSGRLTHTSLLPPQPVITESFADSPPSPSPNSQDVLCGCPTAFPREQRFSDGKTFTVGVKGSYFYPLPLRCGLPVGTCSQPLPPEFPPPKPSWDEATGGLSPPPSKTVPKRTLKQWPPTQRDKTGFGPRSFWCIQNQTYSKNNPPTSTNPSHQLNASAIPKTPSAPGKTNAAAKAPFHKSPCPSIAPNKNANSPANPAPDFPTTNVSKLNDAVGVKTAPAKGNAFLEHRKDPKTSPLVAPPIFPHPLAPGFLAKPIPTLD